MKQESAVREFFGSGDARRLGGSQIVSPWGFAFVKIHHGFEARLRDGLACEWQMFLLAHRC